MLFAGGFAGDVGIRPFGYVTSMVVMTRDQPPPGSSYDAWCA